MTINFIPGYGNNSPWLKWPAPGLTEEEATDLANYLGLNFAWLAWNVSQ